jgi:hypothetical protein
MNRLLCMSIAASLSGAASAQTPTPHFAYFMDNFTDANLQVALPPGSTVIGWASATQRTTLAAAGRIVGTSTGMSTNGGSKILWSDPGIVPPALDLKHLFNTATPPDLSTPAARQQFASLILPRGKATGYLPCDSLTGIFLLKNPASPPRAVALRLSNPPRR